MASTGSAFSFLTTMARPATWSRSLSATTDSGAISSAWLGTMAFSLSNQKAETLVSTSPLPAIGVGITTSKADRRSVVTISSLSSPTA